MNPKARHNARYYALQAMYQWQINETPLADLEMDFLVNHIKKKTDVEYFKDLIHHIPKKSSELDEIIKPFVTRSLQEIDPVELAILRLGTYELTQRLDIPYRVAINEALELTKLFGSVEGYKFVNSILDHVARKYRHHEIFADKK